VTVYVSNYKHGDAAEAFDVISYEFNVYVLSTYAVICSQK